MILMIDNISTELIKLDILVNDNRCEWICIKI
jgi:hypothetical protein